MNAIVSRSDAHHDVTVVVRVHSSVAVQTSRVVAAVVWVVASELVLLGLALTLLSLGAVARVVADPLTYAGGRLLGASRLGGDP